MIHSLMQSLDVSNLFLKEPTIIISVLFSTNGSTPRSFLYFVRLLEDCVDKFELTASPLKDFDIG